MKKNIKIIASAVVIGGLIFSFLLGTPPSTFSLEKSGNIASDCYNSLPKTFRLYNSRLCSCFTRR